MSVQLSHRRSGDGLTFQDQDTVSLGNVQDFQLSFFGRRASRGVAACRITAERVSILVVPTAPLIDVRTRGLWAFVYPLASLTGSPLASWKTCPRYPRRPLTDQSMPI